MGRKNRGGRRKGAGRPKGSKNQSTLMQDDIKAHAIEMIKYHVEDLIQAKLELALGDFYEEKIDPVGAVKVYKARPSGGDINDLLAYAIGKPAQKVEVDGRILQFQEIGDNLRAILGGKQYAQSDATASQNALQG